MDVCQVILRHGTCFCHSKDNPNTFLADAFRDTSTSLLLYGNGKYGARCHSFTLSGANLISSLIRCCAYFDFKNDIQVGKVLKSSFSISFSIRGPHLLELISTFASPTNHFMPPSLSLSALQSHVIAVLLVNFISSEESYCAATNALHFLTVNLTFLLRCQSKSSLHSSRVETISDTLSSVNSLIPCLTQLILSIRHLQPLEPIHLAVVEFTRVFLDLQASVSFFNSPFASLALSMSLKWVVASMPSHTHFPRHFRRSVQNLGHESLPQVIHYLPPAVTTIYRPQEPVAESEASSRLSNTPFSIQKPLMIASLQLWHRHSAIHPELNAMIVELCSFIVLDKSVDTSPDVALLFSRYLREGVGMMVL